jgi:hypothetical protein
MIAPCLHNTHTFILKTPPPGVITCKHVFIHKYREQPSKNKAPPTIAKLLEEHRNKTIEKATIKA